MVLLGGINNSNRYIIKMYQYFGYTFQMFTGIWLLESVTEILVYFYNISIVVIDST